HLSEACKCVIIGSLVFRVAALFAISVIVNVWQVQAIGAVYLIYLGFKNVFSSQSGSDKKNKAETEGMLKGFWATVAKIGLADLAFAVDSILAAVAMAIVLPDSPLPHFGGMDAAQFIIVVLAGIAGLILIKLDRKSTRLNSSHVSISYAVFCLKKKQINLYLI